MNAKKNYMRFVTVGVWNDVKSGHRFLWWNVLTDMHCCTIMFPFMQYVQQTLEITELSKKLERHFVGLAAMSMLVLIVIRSVASVIVVLKVTRCVDSLVVVLKVTRCVDSLMVVLKVTRCVDSLMVVLKVPWSVDSLKAVLKLTRSVDSLMQIFGARLATLPLNLVVCFISLNLKGGITKCSNAIKQIE
jgi:hypothetical protein